FISPLLRKASLKRLEEMASFNAYLCEALSGIRTIKAFVAENRISHLIKKYLIKYNKAFFKEATLDLTSGGISDFLATLSLLSIFWLGGHFVIKEKLTLGSLLAFSLLFERLLAPWRELADLNDDLQRALSAIERFYEIFDLKEELKDSPRAIKLPLISGNIEFRDVSFSYNGNQEALSRISLSIKEGMTLALVGRSGAGKSTLTYLILRFYNPSSGSVLIDGYNLANVKTSSLRKQISLVSQEPFLFSGTIRENLGFRLKINEDEMIDACCKAGIHNFIKDFPLGYETKIGERGIALSGGQRQMVSIARAILKNAPILILDEPTSSCDFETERLIQSALFELMKGKTTIIIAHRLFTIKKADLIVVLDKGKIKETGKHQELMEKRGLYYSLYEQALVS
ncbi:MAG: peptidase domain-containing ABC transporter, partial [bacterium]